MFFVFYPTNSNIDKAFSVLWFFLLTMTISHQRFIKSRIKTATSFVRGQKKEKEKKTKSDEERRKRVITIVIIFVCPYDLFRMGGGGGGGPKKTPLPDKEFFQTSAG